MRSHGRKGQRVPPGQKIVQKWPVLHHGGVPEIDISKWSFKIGGLVDEKLRLNYDEFRGLPRFRVLADIHCVTGWSKLDNIWEGVSSRTIGALAGVQDAARFVLVRSAGGYTTNLSVEDFFGGDVLFAFRHNGRELTPEHGFPVRLVVPRLYFWKSAKWVTELEFREEDVPGFWESRGYHNRGNPWSEERFAE
jgi:DMSO/TMAO reductase YedYZ molybdopterin-dependent catalytic subunit